MHRPRRRYTLDDGGLTAMLELTLATHLVRARREQDRVVLLVDECRANLRLFAYVVGSAVPQT